MFRRLAHRLCAVTLANGTVLKGQLNPANTQSLLSGAAILPDGRVFSGTFDQTKGFPLPGSQLEEDGDLYKGSFNEQWQRHGDGEAWLTDGTHYKGVFEKDDLVQGTVRIPNGTDETIFNGTLKDEMFVRGELRQHDFTYSGEFSDNQPHGKGKLVFSSGAEQEGTFFAGKLHGNGCKMKLNGGFVYVGDFVDGRITSGTLYSPTYTYEGEFNEHGRAHGEGSQTYLINEPRLTFTGIWNNGQLVRGACVDEYGTPVDWQENHALQQKILGDAAQTDGEEEVAVSSYCGAKLYEADQLHRQMNHSYAQDAESVQRSTGHFPSKLDLGYEGGIRAEHESARASSQKQLHDMEKSKDVFSQKASTFDALKDDIQVNNGVLAELNENMAKIQFTRQMGAEQLAAQRVDEQFERFMKTFNRPDKKTQPPAGNDGGEAQPLPRTLGIDGNAPWKSFTPQK